MTRLPDDLPQIQEVLDDPAALFGLRLHCDLRWCVTQLMRPTTLKCWPDCWTGDAARFRASPHKRLTLPDLGVKLIEDAVQASLEMFDAACWS